MGDGDEPTSFNVSAGVAERKVSKVMGGQYNPHGLLQYGLLQLRILAFCAMVLPVVVAKYQTLRAFGSIQFPNRPASRFLHRELY